MRYMKVVYLATKTIPIKPFTICISHHLGLEVETQRGALHSLFFAILHDKRNIFRQFFQPPYTEPVALFLKFPTRVFVCNVFTTCCPLSMFVLHLCIIIIFQYREGFIKNCSF